METCPESAQTSGKRIRKDQSEGRFIILITIVEKVEKVEITLRLVWR
jgi:hypothetical protein